MQENLLFFGLCENRIGSENTENKLNRTQKVFISMSNPKHTYAGVLQGPVLRPLFFFRVYVNDIIDNLLNISWLFADDASLAFTSSNLADLEGILNHDLQIISVWAKQWFVDFSPNETDAMLFTLEKNITPPLLLFDQTQVNKWSCQNRYWLNSVCFSWKFALRNRLAFLIRSSMLPTTCYCI